MPKLLIRQQCRYNPPRCGWLYTPSEGVQLPERLLSFQDLREMKSLCIAAGDSRRLALLRASEQMLQSLQLLQSLPLSSLGPLQIRQQEIKLQQALLLELMHCDGDQADTAAAL